MNQLTYPLHTPQHRDLVYSLSPSKVQAGDKCYWQATDIMLTRISDAAWLLGCYELINNVERKLLFFISNSFCERRRGHKDKSSSKGGQEQKTKVLNNTDVDCCPLQISSLLLILHALQTCWRSCRVCTANDFMPRAFVDVRSQAGHC